MNDPSWPEKFQNAVVSGSSVEQQVAEGKSSGFRLTTIERGDGVNSAEVGVGFGREPCSDTEGYRRCEDQARYKSRWHGQR